MLPEPTPPGEVPAYHGAGPFRDSLAATRWFAYIAPIRSGRLEGCRPSTTNPDAFRRIVRLIEKLADPCTDPEELGQEISRVMRIPPGPAN